MSNFNHNWICTLIGILAGGSVVTPRKIPTLELQHHTITADMRRPIITVPGRKLNYQFMLAEALWIMSGSNRVEDIAPYNKHISKFSDDGVVFAGAYGPMVRDQFGYVVKTLLADVNTRQACMTIWRPNPPPSKDIPCTTVLDFKIRNGKLNCHVFMRSSDVWLGLPYDVFTFSMIAHMVCAEYNTLLGHKDPDPQLIKPGILYLTAASSHLYQDNNADALAVVEAYQAHINDVELNLPNPTDFDDYPKTPKDMFLGPASVLQFILKAARDDRDQRWWAPRAKEI